MRNILLIVMCVSVIGCQGNVRENLGLRKQAPNEFKVISNPPLSVPPEFFVRPPSQAQFSDSVVDKSAKDVVFEPASSDFSFDVSAVNGELGVSYDDLSEGEKSFLSLIGASEANPNIKQLLNEEEARELDVMAQEDGKIFSKFTSFTKKLRGDEEGDSLVNANKERERIITNKQEGKSVLNGDTPVVEPTNKGVLGRIFDF